MNRVLLSLATVFLAGCVAQPTKLDMSAFHAAKPRSILVVPVINKSLDVDAPNYVLSTLPVPLAERGYYVFPVNTTKYILEQEGLYDADRVHKEPPEALAKMFDADAVLYVQINRWDAEYLLIAARVTVDFDYRMVSKDGTEIWKEHRTMMYSPQNDSSGHPLAILIGAVINAALTRAAPNYLPLTKQANQHVFVLGTNALPDGPYRPTELKK
jgi:hypothetical protein